MVNFSCERNLGSEKEEGGEKQKKDGRGGKGEGRTKTRGVRRHHTNRSVFFFISVRNFTSMSLACCNLNSTLNSHTANNINTHTHIE